MIVPRTATPLAQRRDGMWQRLPSQPLADFRAERAYVLLGDPGSGKTTTFREEAKAQPIHAGRFVTADLDQRQEWRTQTLFIDGLDEVRAEIGASSKPLFELLGRLEQLSYPPVRVSCRVADWSAADHGAFAEDYPDVRILLLDPLTARDVSAIMEAHGRSADALVAAAYDNGINHLLTNPLMLTLLIDTSTDTVVLESKAAILENACKMMALERPTRHRVVDSADAIVSAAGQLSALSLLADKAFISRHRPEAGDPNDCLFLDEAQGDQRILLRSFQSKLFSGAALGQVAPIHPQVAEYLAARYLADAITRDHVPATRVLALLSGPDNAVVPTLRGVAAWLATFVPTVRRHLIESDPVGVLVYGDPTRLDDRDKELLLTSLATLDDAVLDFWSLSGLAVGGLVGPATTRVVRRHIDAPDRSDSAQRAMALLFHGVAGRHSNRFDITIKELRDVATEPSWSRRVRSTALTAAIAMAQRCNTTTPLSEVLEDIRNGKVPDPDNQLRGLLLRELYPDIISPKRIWEYYPEDSGTGTTAGANELFWHLLAEPEQSSSDDVAMLLDGLSEQRDRLGGDLGTLLTATAERLLERGIEEHGDRVPIGKLYEWMEAVAWEPHPREWRLFDNVIDASVDDWFAFRPLSIQSWLAERPEMQLELLAELWRRRDAQNFRYELSTFTHLICKNAYPVDYPRWCRECALKVTEDQPAVAQLLLDKAVLSKPQQIALRRSDHPVFVDYARELAGRKERPREITKRQRHRRAKHNRRLADAVHKYAEALMGRSAPPRLLDQLARAYLGVGQYSKLWNQEFDLDDILLGRSDLAPPPSNESEEPMDRLRRALAGDEEAMTTAIRGLRLVLSRDDLPSARNVLELDEENRRSYLVYPLLAAIVEAETRGEDICVRSDDWIERSLVYWAVVPLGNCEIPAWVYKLLDCRTETVADALVAVGKSQIRRDVWDGEQLKRLAAEDRYATVAAETALRLAGSWPSRCNGSQAGGLQFALRIVLRSLSSISDLEDRVVALMDAKSTVAGMDVKQKATWLGVGLRLALDRYVERVIGFLDAGEPVRLWHLVEFLAGQDMEGVDWQTNEDAEALGTLVHAVASRCRPWSWRDRDPSVNFVTTRDSAELAAEKLVETWTAMLARDPDVAAGNVLKALAEDAHLASWRHIVEPKYSEWRIARRVAEYRVPSVREVQETLGGGTPANAGDFAALLVDKLEELAIEIRHGNTDDWKQYWNVDDHGRATDPRHEDPCRDALLSDLRQRLVAGVDAQPEGHYADDKRADIRVTYGDWAIPIEIKKNSHRQLSSAIEKQLIAKYTRDPRSSGFGIYVVLWFGTEHTRVVPPCGHHPKPDTPEELKRCLEEGLTDEQRRMIRVVVIDVSRLKPSRRPSGSGESASPS